VTPVSLERPGDRRSTGAAGRPAPLTRLERGAFVALLAVAAGLLVPNLDTYPATWFDEGWWLQIPRNLVVHGRYAPLSGGEFRPTDTVVLISPAFYLPVAAAFKLFGVGLLQARLVIAVQFLMAAALLFVVARRLYQAPAALLALALFVFVQPDDYWTAPLLYGRQMMAEVPALMWWLAGTYWWLRWRDSERPGHAMLAGASLATCAAVKPQFGIVLVPTLLIMAAAEWWMRRRLPPAAWFVPAAMVATAALHVILLVALLGPGDFARLLTGFVEASGPQVRTFLQPSTVRRGLGLAARSSYVLLLLPAVAYALVRLTSGREIDLRRALPAVYVAVWLGWFIAATPGWNRYALPAVALGVIPVAGAVGAVMRTAVRRPAAHGFATLAARAPQVAAVAFVATLVGQQAATLARGILQPPPPDAQRMTSYLEAQVPIDAVIATWEWPLAFLAGEHRFLMPPTPVLNSVIARNEFGVPWASPPFDLAQQRVDYVAVGWFSRWSGVFPQEYLDNHCDLAYRAGDYELYRVRR
jgi:4-amino-4-deoxy-L-arabinose transferase-like glycosyltransferase